VSERSKGPKFPGPVAGCRGETSAARFFGSRRRVAAAPSLADASERGVTIHIGTVVDAVRERIDDAEIEASVFTTGPVEWFTSMSGTPQIGRLLMADREPVLVSATHDEKLPGVVNETAAWSDGIDHGFATFTERVLTYELRQNVGEEYDQTDSE
jgi:hypothetical protein